MLNQLKSHASVRLYKDEPITDKTFYEMLHAAQHAASSNFAQAYSVIRVKDPVKKDWSMPQNFIKRIVSPD